MTCDINENQVQSMINNKWNTDHSLSEYSSDSLPLLRFKLNNLLGLVGDSVGDKVHGLEFPDKLLVKVSTLFPTTRERRFLGEVELSVSSSDIWVGKISTGVV